MSSLTRRDFIRLAGAAAAGLLAGCGSTQQSAIPPASTAVPTPTPTLTPTPTPVPSPTPTATPRPTPTPTPIPLWDLRTSTPERQGVDSDVLVAMLEHVQRQALQVYSVLVVRHGSMVLEAYRYPYRRTSVGGVASCTKSVTSALVGIALEEGYIEGIDQKVLDFFPDRAIANDGPRKRAMTLEHLLTMRCGLDWPEFATAYSSPSNILRQMFRSEDYVQFVLDRRMVAEPGAVFNYSTGASHVLGAAVERATGMHLRAFARSRLFEPLGITDRSWYFSAAPEGVDFGGGGLHITSRALATFGCMYLQGGAWEGRRVVPADWVEASVAGVGYGYQWWLMGNGDYAALGYPGHRVAVMPDLDMTAVVTGRCPGSASRYLVDAFIGPAARSAEPLPENPEGVASLEVTLERLAKPPSRK